MKKILICGAGGFIGGHLAKMFDNEKNIQLRGEKHMGADKFRSTIELMHEVHHVFDPSKKPVGVQGKPLIVMADQHASEHNIDDNHFFIETKRLFD